MHNDNDIAAIRERLEAHRRDRDRLIRIEIVAIVAIYVASLVFGAEALISWLAQ